MTTTRTGSAALALSIALGLSATTVQATDIRIAVQAGAGNQAAFDALIAKFEAQSDIHVVPEYVGGNYSATITTRLQGGNAPDIVWLVPGGPVPHSVWNLAKSDRLVDLSDAGFVDSILPSALPLVSVDGEVYAWPASVQVNGLIVNENLFSANDIAVPTTFDEMLKTCAAFREKGIVPISWVSVPQTRNGSQVITVGSGTGASLASVNAPILDGSSSFAKSPEWQDAMKTVVALVDANCLDEGAAAANDAQATSLMLRQDAAMMISNTQQLGILLASDVAKSVDFRVHPFPPIAGQETRVIGSAYDALSVTKASKNPHAAIAFLDFLAQPDNQRELAAGLGNIAPVNAADGVMPETMTALSPYFKSGKADANPVISWTKRNLYLTMSAGVQGLLTGQTTPESVLADMDRELTAQ